MLASETCDALIEMGIGIGGGCICSSRCLEFGFATYDGTLFAMTAPTDSLVTDWMTEEDMFVVVFVFAIVSL
jgi:hypothetical protein